MLAVVETLLAAFVAFAATNIDDIFINTVFFASAGSKRQMLAIVLGKYLGIGALFLVSLAGAFLPGLLPGEYKALLGVIPIALGVKEIVARNKSSAQKAYTGRSIGALSMALVTVANGADNIGVYVPLLASFAVWQILVSAGIFLILIALWCYIGKKLAELPKLKCFLVKYKHIILPTLLIALGVFIILRGFI